MSSVLTFIELVVPYVKIESSVVYKRSRICCKFVFNYAEVVKGVATTYRTPATIETLSDVPPLVLDSDMTQASLGYVGAVLPKAAFLPLFHAMASEDFALISSEIPSAYFTVGAAVTDTDEHFAQHHPKARFNDAELPLGAAAYAAVALGYIADHKE